jgi:16S rRNA (cytosine1402-N4)-methyltransferase
MNPLTPEILNSHLPVLYQKTILSLCPRSPGFYVDGTVGAGGHASGLLEASAPEGYLLGFDIDPQALALASQHLSDFASRVTLIQASYSELLIGLKKMGWKQVQGILVDLGMSSMQVDSPDRGFSFLADGPLDMRFNPCSSITASHLINQLPEKDLADVIWRYGEDPQSRKIAKMIVQSRPLATTQELAIIVKNACRDQHKRIHPATRTFQALRIAVNQELHILEEFLPQAIQALAPGGRLAIISFHSLEDRIVKQFFKRESRDCICPSHQPMCTCGHFASVKLVNRRPIIADEEETRANPRSRSARLRVVEKLEVA